MAEHTARWHLEAYGQPDTCFRRAMEAAIIPPMESDTEELVATINQLMPFGRYKGRRLIELPEPYLVWFHHEGFPDGVLGRRMAVMYEIKVNGLESMLQPLTEAAGRRDESQ